MVIIIALIVVIGILSVLYVNNKDQNSVSLAPTIKGFEGINTTYTVSVNSVTGTVPIRDVSISVKGPSPAVSISSYTPYLSGQTRIAAGDYFNVTVTGSGIWTVNLTQVSTGNTLGSVSIASPTPSISMSATNEGTLKGNTTFIVSISSITGPLSLSDMVMKVSPSSSVTMVPKYNPINGAGQKYVLPDDYISLTVNDSRTNAGRCVLSVYHGTTVVGSISLFVPSS